MVYVSAVADEQSGYLTIAAVMTPQHFASDGTMQLRNVFISFRSSSLRLCRVCICSAGGRGRDSIARFFEGSHLLQLPLSSTNP